MEVYKFVPVCMILSVSFLILIRYYEIQNNEPVNIFFSIQILNIYIDFHHINC